MPSGLVSRPTASIFQHLATANGAARVAQLTLEVRLGDIAVRDVPAAVAERGALAINLLGMSFLGRLKNFEMKGRELVLVQ